MIQIDNNLYITPCLKCGFACGNPHFYTSWYKISYDTRAKIFFLTSVIASLVRKRLIVLVS